MKLRHSVVRSFLAALAPAVLLTPASCDQPSPAPGTTAPVVLAQLVRRGGLCPGGACAAELTVFTDGRWKGLRSGSEQGGELRTGDRDRLSAAVARTALAGPVPVRSGPCADAADGMVTTYFFTRSGTSFSVDSCQYRIPAGDTFVVIIEELFDRLLP